ncbi:MAG: hypothetical protein SFV21_08710 [Rhodospirillaceae bacterium]|nr:hypothetical protein [Rhodospirillaceae bacterium]
MANQRHPSRAALALLAAVAAAAAGCAGAPYVDSRREAGQTAAVGTSTPDRVAICYSDSATTPQALLQMADAECAKTGRRARFDRQDKFSCALRAPTRAYFRCVSG